VLSAGPTPRVGLRGWDFTITTEPGQVHTWDWATFQAPGRAASNAAAAVLALSRVPPPCAKAFIEEGS